MWAALETVAAEEILGEWKGDDFATGHRLHEKLFASRWYGKTFNSVEDAKPLICRDEDGNLYSDVKSGNGEASLWNIEFRGEVTATMVYDGAPITRPGCGPLPLRDVPCLPRREPRRP